MMYVLLFRSCSYFYFLIALEIAILFPPLDSHSEFCNKIKSRYYKNQVVHSLLCILISLEVGFISMCAGDAIAELGWLDSGYESSRSKTLSNTCMRLLVSLCERTLNASIAAIKI